MYGGRCVERGTKKEVLRSPQHPYTWGLLGSMPSLDGPVDVPLSPIPGSPPSLLNPPSGCRFHPRCTFTEQVGGGRCSSEQPLLELTGGRGAACHLTSDQRSRFFADIAGSAGSTGSAGSAGSAGSTGDAGRGAHNADRRD